jgi:5-methyltetrahydropteroyltriglutamate--homocysteine methyltransferase
VGLGIFSDGEYRRGIWYDPLVKGIGGLVPNKDAPRTVGVSWQGRGADLAHEMMREVGSTEYVVGENVTRVRRLTGHETGFLKQHAPGPWKTTMPGILTRASGWYKPGVTDKVYPTQSELVADLVKVVQAEVKDLIAEGCSYIQLDSLLYVLQLASPERREGMRAAGWDLDRLLDDSIATDNASLEPARGSGVTVGLHMCRGNNRSSWATEGSYEPIAEKAFGQLNVDRFLLEYDTERAGGFEPLRFVPKHKMVVIGIMSSKEPRLETVDELQRRVEEAARYIPLENLAISPQCGFASTYQGNLVTWDDQRRKLARIVETAQKIWG